MRTKEFKSEEADAPVFGTHQMREPAPSEYIPENMTPAEISYRIVKDETFPQTQPRLNLATFVTTYMDDYGTRLMNEAVGINYIDASTWWRTCGILLKKANDRPNLVTSTAYQVVWEKFCQLWQIEMRTLRRWDSTSPVRQCRSLPSITVSYLHLR